MTRINVRVSSPSFYTKLSNKKAKINVSSSSGIIMARKLADLMDVDLSNVQDNYILMYDAEEQKYKAYDPGEILSASTLNGLPQDFIDYLNQTLEPEILVQAIADVVDYINNLTLGKLANVDEGVDFASDTFLIRYNEQLGKYEAVDPDEILSSAIDETGLPGNFIDYLNEVLIPQSLVEALEQINNEIQTLNLGDLANVDDESVLDKYVIMFNGITRLYETVNPDEVLRASVTEETEEGLPNEFLDQLDEDLDNRIDVDAGEY